MNFERAKSIILIILVGTSIFLTWSIWTYEPEYDPFEQSSEFIKIKSDVQIVSDVIKPVSILFHGNGQHFQTSNPAEINEMEKQFSQWRFRGIKEISVNRLQRKFDDFVHEDGSIEIEFSDDIPISLYKTVLNITDKEVPEFSFDRIIIKQKNISGNESAVYFVSYDKRKIYQSMVDSKKLRNFMDSFYRGSYDKHPEYTAETINSKRTLFVPENPVEINRLEYYIDYLDIGDLKSALFINPKYVRQEPVSVGEEYTDGTRLMTVNKDNYLISYINPAQKRKLFGSSSDLLQKSIDFINEHAGWENNNYRFAYMSENEQRVVFRLFVNGYPAFNESGMTEIEQIWGKEEIYSYDRPYFKLDSVLPSVRSAKTLPSGKEVVNQLKSKDNVDFNSVEDISIGYRLDKSLDSKLVTLVTLEPTWYYRIGDKWFIVPFDDTGGDRSGLE
ncbi:YycH family regulatory protein [Peribacillus frigoritolerans]|uniref:YycH family regulatory protein n=1 Tax=Peribacillus frigoritolerans TaxID=450367 RepID=UPI0020418260|nr:two-component system activity regulator YycH [Peribacillus frigoritolerans]MCM3168366.1 two-component system activity regulator YycH [Peribacillus frigoritolerans]MDP9738204.1 regulatory protein YycH of two-component signal transduction system YycFG [Bacillus sp. B2I3]MEB2627364.1 two-component system activity regulator YycH [Peribacillus frigoritolerans]UZD46996.1 two-component system activity regulator YycH [Peribacillus frigoritolerans]